MNRQFGEIDKNSDGEISREELIADMMANDDADLEHEVGSFMATYDNNNEYLHQGFFQPRTGRPFPHVISCPCVVRWSAVRSPRVESGKVMIDEIINTDFELRNDVHSHTPGEDRMNR